MDFCSPPLKYFGPSHPTPIVLTANMGQPEVEMLDNNKGTKYMRMKLPVIQVEWDEERFDGRIRIRLAFQGITAKAHFRDAC